MTEPALRFHHVGYVVPDIAVAAPGFAATLRAHWAGEVFIDPLQKVKVTFLSHPGTQVQTELVEPLDESSPVHRFLHERKGGLHHYCFETAELEAEMARIRAAGGVIVSRPKPAVAFGGRHIAWLISAEGLLLELLDCRKSS